MAFPFAALFTTIGSAVSGFFGLKKEQGEVIKEAIKTIESTSDMTAKEVQAIAAIIQAEAKSDSWLTSSWRPLVMLVFTGMIVAFFFGYIPPGMDKPMPPMVAELFTLLKLGIGGYMGGRTIEKLGRSLALGKTIKTFIEKKLA